MNDADLGQNIEARAGQLEQAKAHDRVFENDEAHLDPSRWWFASSAFPMIAGTLGPVASAFSICALVRPWRQHVPPGVDITVAEFEKDPTWLLVVNGIQLVVAIVSNIFLLLNMARRVRFSIAQPITVVGWYISSICLLSLNATAAGPLLLNPKQEWVWSQAFWYGMFAAILYFIVASLMVVTIYGAFTKQYAKDFQLTNSQRTLMLQTIMFLVYLLVGALVFSTIEGWSYLDAVYWADVTLFTVGFGDFACTTNLGRALVIPYALIGVISLGLVIGSIRSLVLERGRRRLDARMVEKERRTFIRKMTRRGTDDILKPIESDDRQTSTGSDNNSHVPRTELERREEEFNLMRKVQDEASKRRRWMAMCISFGTWVVLWLVGAKIFQVCEAPYQNWTYFEGFYFAFVTLTTIGYGDRTPVSNCGKAFFVFWSLLALPTMTVMISNAGDTVVKSIRDFTLQLGNITILPGERGFKKDVKSILHSMTCGTLFADDDDVEDLPPGFLGQARVRRDHNHSDTEDEDNERRYEAEMMSQDRDFAPTTGGPPPMQEQARQPRSQTGHTMHLEHNAHNAHCATQHSTYTARIRRSLSRARDPHAALPTNRADYHYLLIAEIAAVVEDLKLSHPKRYTFAEWAWYLKLIGEDESSADKHRKAKPHVHKKKLEKRKARFGDTFEAEPKGKEEGEKWSWMGSRSPLMGSQEESEWILERLTDKLSDELLEVRREEEENPSVFDREHGLEDKNENKDENKPVTA